MRIFAISDLHIDFPDNQLWVNQLSQADYQQDLLIVAGDIHHQLKEVSKFFEQIKSKFGEVMYVPGNHDLWVPGEEAKTSQQKYRELQNAALSQQVHTAPFEAKNAVIVPLRGWYDYSFGQPSEALREKWMDFHACQWESDEAETTRWFTGQNVLPAVAADRFVISFSHFLPRIDLMPEHLPEKFRELYPVLGSSILEQQVRQLSSKIHIYGHSHLNRRVEKQGTLYINNALGYPREATICARQLLCIHEI